MNSYKSIGLFSVFLLFLSLIRLWDKDIIGFFLFILFSLLFFLSYSLELYRITKQGKIDKKRKVFFNASPKITLKNDGNSQITTLIVPSLELFNEMKKDDRDI